MLLLGVLLCPGTMSGCEKVRALIPGGEAPKPAEAKKAAAGEEKAEPSSAPKKTAALVVAFEGYQDLEFDATRKALEDAGIVVEVVSLFAGQASGALGGKIRVDLLLEDAVKKVADYAAVVFIGGPGSTIYHEDKLAWKFAQEAVKAGKVVGAICLGPFTLANAGVLTGVKATAWTGGKFTKESFMKLGPYFREEPVVVDGKIVTADGPRASDQFAGEIVKLLK
jgi:protease I